MGSSELPEALQALLIELDDRRKWQEWDAKDLRPLCQRAKESAQAQGVEDDKFQRKVDALFDGMAQQPRRDTLVAKLKEWKEEVKRLRGRRQAASRRAVSAASAANGSVDGDGGDGGDGSGGGEGEGGESCEADGGDADGGELASLPAAISSTGPPKSKPKRGLSSFMLWLNANRAAIKEEHPDAKVTEVGSIAGAKWREMDAEAKAPWEAKAKADKKRYEAEVEAYNASQRASAADGSGEEVLAAPAAAFEALAREAGVEVDQGADKTALAEAILQKLEGEGAFDGGAAGDGDGKIPWNLHGYARRSLEKLGVPRLKQLCLERGIEVKKKARMNRCLDLLMSFKRHPTPEDDTLDAAEDEEVAMEEAQEEEEQEQEQEEEEEAAAAVDAAGDDAEEAAAVDIPEEFAKNPLLVNVRQAKLLQLDRAVLHRLCADRAIPGLRKNSRAEWIVQKLAQWRGSSASKRWAKEWAAEVADDAADDGADDTDEPKAGSSSTGAADSEPTLAVLDKVYVDGVSKRRGTVKEISLDNQVKVYIPFEGPARWFAAAAVRKAPAPASSSSASGGSASSAGTEPPPPPLHPAKKQKPDQSAPSQSSVDAFAGLSDDQRDHVLFLLGQYREANAAKAENERLREENEVLRGELARDGSLLRVAQQRVAQLEKGKGVFFKKDKKGLDKITGYMSKSEFQKRLIELDLITLQPGAKQEGQHVFHIIAVANGGPDHVDNFLYALGGTFNMAIGDKYDHLNCFLAGKEKARRAVDIAKETARDPALHKHIELRGKKEKRVLFTEGPHKYKSGEELFAEGQSLFSRSILAAGRADRKAS